MEAAAKAPNNAIELTVFELVWSSVFIEISAKAHSGVFIRTEMHRTILDSAKSIAAH